MLKKTSPRRAAVEVSHPTFGRKITVISDWSDRMLQYDNLQVKEKRLSLAAVRKVAKELGLCAHLRTDEELLELEALVGVDVPTAEDEGRSRRLAFHDGDVVIKFHKKKGRNSFTLLVVEVDRRPRDWFQELLTAS